MKQDGRANGFDQTLDGWVRVALGRGVRTFPELVQSLPGVYPADVLRAVGRLRQELPVGWQLSAPPSVAQPMQGWPVEHPLDFDWRFTAEAVRLLIERCQGRTFDSVTFLGAPSLAREAVARARWASVSLFDQNPAIVEAIRASLRGVTVTCIDLVWGDPVGVGDTAVAMADPPWYPEHIGAFLWAAGRLTRLGGRVLLSLPPVGTRPGISAEREAVFEWAAAFGLQLDSIAPGVLGYRTPPFERNALAAAGVPAVPLDWRRGDLAEFVVTDKTSVGRPTPFEPADQWDQEAIGVVRIMCKRCSDRLFHDPTLLPAVAGDILPSVSRRNPMRAAAEVWTCGNRVFRCKGVGVFRVILSALGRGADVNAAVARMIGREPSSQERKMVQRATDQVIALAHTETMEIVHGYAAPLGWGGIMHTSEERTGPASENQC
ncbi:hypothetical protein AYO44_05020 [Planctomycetaceae bacterium SCGC AG-212-F19]|nr:hypothetical protein AYO44_05020 [Planctomycetaceae bacterium SCGC AG-212-F19]